MITLKEILSQHDLSVGDAALAIRREVISPLLSDTPVDNSKARAALTQEVRVIFDDSFNRLKSYPARREAAERDIATLAYAFSDEPINEHGTNTDVLHKLPISRLLNPLNADALVRTMGADFVFLAIRNDMYPHRFIGQIPSSSVGAAMTEHIRDSLNNTSLRNHGYPDIFGTEVAERGTFDQKEAAINAIAEATLKHDYAAAMKTAHGTSQRPGPLHEQISWVAGELMPLVQDRIKELGKASEEPAPAGDPRAWRQGAALVAKR